MKSLQEGREAGTGRPRARRVVYCVIPADLAPKLHDLLRRHFSDARDVKVIVERRSGDRRRDQDRRLSMLEREGEKERRKVTNPTGRRMGERRAPVTEIASQPELPRRARRWAERIVFVERVEHARERDEDLDTARKIARFQGGDREIFADLYLRYFDRVYAYMRVCLRGSADAEDAAQQVFTQALAALPEFRADGPPFRGWLFAIARNLAISELRRSGRTEPMDPQKIAEQVSETQEPEELPQLDWITDPDLTLFVERLPAPQRQALSLRYVLDLPHAEIARIMGRTPEDVRVLQHRAVAVLRDRLAAIGRVPNGEGRRIKMSGRVPQAYVLRSRRWALDP